MAITASRPARAHDDGVEGNERLTGLVGALLLAPLAVEGLTILRIGQLLWLHMFLGMVLVGIIALKLASTGYRFAGYYRGRSSYVAKGPPITPLRLLAVPVVLSTLGVMITGILLLLLGPSSRQPLELVHKVCFIVWIAVTAVHVLAHLKDSFDSVGAEVAPLATGTPQVSRRGARLLALGTAVMIGVIIALITLPQFGAWTSAYGH
ncbi:MAG TPA: hypothetical protein VG223_07285 [Solirubrobacteraceae bacterium]|jgi:hypothetical protein|nr:hypothetical protein [Solirubrobacteraceae bacterium]